MFKRQAFSLIELLMVIGIISLLVGMLLPALSKARRSSQSVQCRSQLRQLGIAFHMYASANRGYLPSWSGVHFYPDAKYSEVDGDQDGLSWTEQLMPYYVAPDSKLYQCPSFPVEVITYFIEGRWESMQGQTSIKLGSIKKASEFVISGDCTCKAWYPPPYGTWTQIDQCDKDDANSPCLLFANEPDGLNLHSDGNNVLFSDSHVGAFRQYDPSRMTFNPNRMQSYNDCTAD
ncbi:MAG TPA: type II secretion system protein [Pirellulales bacterium]|jgi:prepilin-type N-terminal cleavage/methylation domain-containing protein/prepilin-type processing-associated H-X9-DG protein